jgi:hypothetical protein
MTERRSDGKTERGGDSKGQSADHDLAANPGCQVCGGRLIEIRGKLQCERCHVIWETCCEGGRWE